MATNRQAFLRIRIIDKAIRNPQKPFPNKEVLRQNCEEELYGSGTGKKICESTIEKDIFVMRMEHDAPIKYDRINKGYYYSDKNYSMEDIPLTESDISAIKNATNILRQFKNNPLFTHFQYAIEKIIDRVSLSDVKGSSFNDNILQFEHLPTIRGNEFLEPILSAVKNRNSIQFSYHKYKDEEKSIRRINPYLLKEYRNRWYVIGKSEIKNRIVTFGLDRIEGLITLDSNFSIDSNFNSDIYFKYTFGITTYEAFPENVVIKVNELLSKYLISQPLHHTQEVIDKQDGTMTLSYFLLPSYELKMQLLGFGSDVTIIQPQSLIEDIKESAKNILVNYE